jgi:hypothetical protein
MEENEIQAGNPKAETPAVTLEPQSPDQQVSATDMPVDGVAAASAPMTDVNAAITEPNAQTTESNARERLRGAVLEQGQVKASNFMRRGGLFDNYEITSAREMPFFMRIFAASALLHLLVFAVALQLPVVVQTTCESTEFTQRLCDTMYVASLVSTAGGPIYVEQPYDQDQIAGGEDVTFITTDGALEYPEGYWTLRDEIEGRSPDQAAIPEPGSEFNFGTVNGVNGANTASPSTLDLTKPPKLPGVNPNAVTGGEITSPFAASTGPAPPFSGGGRRVTGSKNPGKNIPGINTPPSSAANNSTNSVAQNPTIIPNANQAVNTTPQAANPDIVTYSGSGTQKIVINKRVLKDFAGDLSGKVKDNQVDLQAPFTVAVVGELDADGKFDETKWQITRVEGDEKMRAVALQAIQAVSKSGWLGYLKVLGNKRLSFTLQQDQDKILVTINSEVETEEKARSLAGGLNLLMAGGKLLNKGTDEGVLLDGATVTNQGKVFILNFSLDQQVAQPMIQRKLAEVIKPTSATMNANNFSTTGK